ncbi:MAG TPA: glutamate-cysteine ligase family protein [Cyclobacteriaceae bacterium]
MSKPLHLFEAFGVELEYMIVDKETLEVKPIADELFKAMTGKYTGDFENGMITWSNELTLHLIELKCTQPENDLEQLRLSFRANVRQINKELTQWSAMLLPTAAHPLMDPSKHAKLWPHDNGDVYARYNEMFNCKGHGWSNLQSTHLNLPFHGDDEFGRLHAAIRVLMPLLPALCASSPVLNKKVTKYLDARLSYYQENQKSIPSITGNVIPEAIFTKAEYEKQIYKKIAKDIAPFNKDNLLDPVWVNSRGAMARFDRGSIEIRVMDIQECPSVDIAIQSFVIESLRLLVDEKLCSYQQQKNISTDTLKEIYDETIYWGTDVTVYDKPYLTLFEVSDVCPVRDLLQKLLDEMGSQPWSSTIEAILKHGNLANRILADLKGKPTTRAIQNTWRRLADCLQNDTMFIP